MTIYIDGHPYYPGRAFNSFARVVIVGKEIHTFRRNRAERDAKMQTRVGTRRDDAEGKGVPIHECSTLYARAQTAMRACAAARRDAGTQGAGCLACE